jgi:hypothetical protein
VKSVSLLALALCLIAPPVGADVPAPDLPPEPDPSPEPEPPPLPPPPPGQCKTSVVEQRGEQCANCSSSPTDPDRCAHELGDQGYEMRCRDDSGVEWAEVWCRGPGRPPPPSEDPPRSCACALGRDDLGAAGLALGSALALGLAFAARRRTRRG